MIQANVTPGSPDANRPTRHYCTLFDKNYLVRGLALYRSLDHLGENFCLHILCMDDAAADILEALGLARARIIRLRDFETPELLAVKPERTIAEYCWTCAPCLLCHILEYNPDVDLVTYLDADLLFFSSAEPIFEEVGSASSVIVEHRFSPLFKESIVNGKYNVQWVTIRRDVDGLETLYWWRDRCLEWCYYRLEEGRMGDQKYLDQWTTLFKGVHELQHIGAGVAPWNFANYKIVERDGTIFIDSAILIFYHFHSFRMLRNGEYVPMPERYSEFDPVPRCIYDRYNDALLGALAAVKTVEPSFIAGIEMPQDVPISRPTTKGREAPARAQADSNPVQAAYQEPVVERPRWRRALSRIKARVLGSAGQ